ncbi:hypothetical protein [Modestobacter sp. URMC 112]
MDGPEDSPHAAWPEQGGEIVPKAPGGEPLTHGRRLTLRDARSWAKRKDVLLGRWPCGPTVEWAADHERAAFAALMRDGEGKDCNVAGDVLLYRLTDGRPVLVIVEPF